MLTRHGWSTLVIAAAAFVAGRVFGLIELYVLGAGLVAAIVLSVILANRPVPALSVIRRTDPESPVAGEPIRVLMSLSHHRRRSTPELTLWEQVGTVGGAAMSLAPLPPSTRAEATYSIPATRRGLLACGPLRARHTDPFGLAARTRQVAGADEIIVLPVTVPLAAPRIGSPGPLGQMLKAKAVAAGGIDFHGLREYVPGDDPRRISWKASARSTELLIRENADAELRRVTVAIDATIPDEDAFERAISAAASVVLACIPTDLELRVVSQEADIRGPDVITAATRWLALAEPAAHQATVPHGPSTPEGLGVVVLITDTFDAGFAGSARRELGRNQSVVTIATSATDRGVSAHGQMVVHAGSFDQLAQSWNHLIGERGEPA